MIVLNRDRAALLDRLLGSVEAQVARREGLEIIVVDHGSRDDSIAAARRWQGRLPVRLVACRDNHSFAYSCNRAAEIARGDHLLFVNNDIVLTQDVVAPLQTALSARRGMVGIRLFETKDGRTLGRPQHTGVRFHCNRKWAGLLPHEVPRYPLRRDGLVPFPAVTAAVCACVRDDFLRAGGFHEGYAYGYEDVDLCLKFRYGLGLPVLSHPGVSALHGHGETRRGLIGRHRRRLWLAHNVAVLQRRFGYLLRRKALEELAEGEELLCERRPWRWLGDGGIGEAARSFAPERLRVAVKAVPGLTAEATAVADALRAGGHAVRIDWPRRWRGRHGVFDDACLWFSQPAEVPADKINLLLGEGEGIGLDAVTKARPENVLAALAACHERRMVPPLDPPLSPREAANDGDGDGWRGCAPDPVRELLNVD